MFFVRKFPFMLSKFPFFLLSFLLIISMFSALYSVGGADVRPTKPEANTFTGYLGNKEIPVSNPVVFRDSSNYFFLNNSQVVVEFYKGSAGYNKFYYTNGSVMVYDERLVLQRLTNQWRQVGTPFNVTVEKVNDGYYIVKRYYTDYVSTSFEAIYEVQDGLNIKFSVNMSSGLTSQYRLLWSLSGITQFGYVENDVSTVYSEFFVDWSDVYYSIGDIVSSEYSTVAQGRKQDVYFDIGVVNVGSRLVIDPTLGVTSSSTNYYTILADDCAGVVYTTPSEGAIKIYNFTFYTGRSPPTAQYIKAMLVNADTKVIIAIGSQATSTSYNWYTSTFSTPPVVPASSSIALMIIDGTYATQVSHAGTGASGVVDTTNSYSTPTDPTDWASHNYKLSIYCTYVGTPTGTDPYADLYDIDAEAIFTSFWNASGSVMDYYILSHNISGTWANGSATYFNGSTTTVAIATLPSTPNVVVAFKIYANNTAGLMGVTSVQYLTTDCASDTASPKYYDGTYNNSKGDKVTMFTMLFTDTYWLNNYTFCYYNSTVWSNQTYSVTGSNHTYFNASASVTLPHHDITISYVWVIRDYKGNTNTTGVYNLTTTDWHIYLTIENPLYGEVYTSGANVTVSINCVTNSTGLVVSYNVFTSNGTWVFVSNQTYNNETDIGVLEDGGYILYTTALNDDGATAFGLEPFYIGVAEGSQTFVLETDWSVIGLGVGAFMIVFGLIALMYMWRVPLIVYLVGLFTMVVGFFLAIDGIWINGNVAGYFGLFIVVWGGLVMLMTGLGIKVFRR